MSELSNDNIVESQELSLPVTREEPVANDSNDLFGEEDQSTSNQQDDFFSNIQQPDQPDQPIIETNEELETVHKSTDVELPQEIPLEQEQIPQQPQQQEKYFLLRRRRKGSHLQPITTSIHFLLLPLLVFTNKFILLFYFKHNYSFAISDSV